MSHPALPLSALDFAVLMALAPGRSYGYRILRDMREQTGGGIELAPGNLYQVLDRLSERRWIEEAGPSPEEQESRRPRRYHRLTEVGRVVLAAEAGRVEGLVRAARLHDLLPEGSS
jgi:DNA-binding PadR family transcriptional regulator